ncbi:carbohydrate sulfotransferase 6-like [Pseudophryne corroboree]|uniref:carbohydrate sulfotransferase 6-like n=1 Tax=Pseudophryne corroboree TaxID=495146 RepID=UPI003081DF96
MIPRFYLMMSLHLKLLFLLLFMSLAILYLSQILSSRPPSYSYSRSASQKQDTVHVLVVSSWRSGSSFLGQIFNHHNDVFYLFEPGHPTWMKFQQESAELLHYPVRDLLRSLFTCDVSPLQHYLPNGGKRVSEFRFFAESRALCTPPACSAFIPSEGYDRLSCFQRCRNTSFDKMAEICRTYSHVVMKTVRILDLSVLLPLFRDPALDLRILHLVRDPRAVALSRKSFSLRIEDKIVLKNEINLTITNITTSKVMEKICKSQVAINKLARTSQTLRGRYMAIRHEDLTSKPVQSLEQIYKFSGLPLTKELKEWIYNVTHEEIKDKNGFMTFSKMSSKVNQRWRTALDFGLVQQIQHSCEPAMEVFGYLPAKTKNEQKNITVQLINNEWCQRDNQPSNRV